MLAAGQKRHISTAKDFIAISRMVRRLKGRGTATRRRGYGTPIRIGSEPELFGTKQRAVTKLAWRASDACMAVQVGKKVAYVGLSTWEC